MLNEKEFQNKFKKLCKLHNDWRRKIGLSECGFLVTVLDISSVNNTWGHSDLQTPLTRALSASEEGVSYITNEEIMDFHHYLKTIKDLKEALNEDNDYRGTKI